MGGKVAEMLVAATKVEIARTSYTQGIRPAADKAIGSDFSARARGRATRRGREVARDRLQLKSFHYGERLGLQLRPGRGVSADQQQPRHPADARLIHAISFVLHGEDRRPRGSGNGATSSPREEVARV